MDPGSSCLVVTVTDGRGRAVADGGLARWLARLAPARLRGEVAIALVTDRHIRTLNRQFRGKDYATDVLSFPAEDFRLKPEATRSSGVASGFSRKAGAGAELRTANRDPATPRFLGDLVIATGVARRQARQGGHSYATELRVLALHGFLHLLGYDHDDPEDHGRMARAEARLRRRGGLREGLIGRAERPARKKRRPARAAGLPAGAARWPERARLRQGSGGQPSRESAAKVGGKRGVAAPASAKRMGWGPMRTKQ